MRMAMIAVLPLLMGGPPRTSDAQANWRQLRTGMSMDEVRALLGEPEHVEGGTMTYWRWTNAEVQFYRGKLDGWSEPKR